MIEIGEAFEEVEIIDIIDPQISGFYPEGCYVVKWSRNPSLLYAFSIGFYIDIESVQEHFDLHHMASTTRQYFNGESLVYSP